MSAPRAAICQLTRAFNGARSLQDLARTETGAALRLDETSELVVSAYPNGNDISMINDGRWDPLVADMAALDEDSTGKTSPHAAR